MIGVYSYSVASANVSPSSSADHCILHTRSNWRQMSGLLPLSLPSRPGPLSCPLPGVGEAERGLTGGWWLFNAAEEIKLPLLLPAL